MNEQKFPTNVDELLDALKVKWEIDTDYQLAKRFEVAVQVINNYRRHKSVPDDLTAMRMARELGLSEQAMLALMHSERARKGKNPALADTWGDMARKLGVVALASVAVQSALTIGAQIQGEPAAFEAAQFIHYTKYAVLALLTWAVLRARRRLQALIPLKPS